MAVIGRQRVRIDAPWVKVVARVTEVGSMDHFNSGNLITQQSRDPRAGEPYGLYPLSGPRYPSRGPSASKRVVSSLTAQGYQVVEHKEYEWLLELVDPSAPEDIGETDIVSVESPSPSRLLQWLQRKADQKAERRQQRQEREAQGS
jgi:hypothetical protein